MFQTTNQSWNNLQLEKQTGRQGLHQLWGHFWRQKDADRQSIHQKSLDQDVQAVPQESFDDGCCASSWWSMMIDMMIDMETIPAYSSYRRGTVKDSSSIQLVDHSMHSLGCRKWLLGILCDPTQRQGTWTADPSSNTTKAPFHRQAGHEGSSVLHRPNCKPIPPVLQKEVVVGLPIGSGTENIRLDLQFANLPNSSNIYTSH